MKLGLNRRGFDKLSLSGIGKVSRFPLRLSLSKPPAEQAG